MSDCKKVGLIALEKGVTRTYRFFCHPALRRDVAHLFRRDEEGQAGEPAAEANSRAGTLRHSSFPRSVVEEGGLPTGHSLQNQRSAQS